MALGTNQHLQSEHSTQGTTAAVYVRLLLLLDCRQTTPNCLPATAFAVDAGGGDSAAAEQLATAAADADTRGSGSARNRRFEPPAWASSSSSTDSGRGRGRQQSRGRGRRGRGRGRGSVTDGWDSDVSDNYREDYREPLDRQALGGLGVSNEPPGLPQLPGKPRAARIRLQKIREAEKEQRQQERQQWRERQQQQRWRWVKPGELDEE